MNIQQLIDINDLPNSAGGFSRLYCDYLFNAPGIRKYFEHDFHAMQNLQGFASEVASGFAHRTVLTEVLLEQNRRFGAGEKTFENIRLLGESTTLAVVTGQQVGMIGGPLYTFYKAATAIKLAASLRETLPGHRFVPVFWLEGEDHDFEEMNHAGLLSQEGAPVQADYLIEGKLPARNPGPVGEIVFGGDLEAFFNSLTAILPNSEFKPAVIEFLRKHYTPGSTFNTAFASLLNSWFGDEGLVFISSNDARLKKLVSPHFQKEIREFPKVSQLVIAQSADLERHYHAQIKTKALNLFYFYKGGRYFIEPREKDFSLKGTRHFITPEEMMNIAVNTPELLSPNVALRPICQDTILPTFAYVAGPSEIAYFAQLKSVYQYFGMKMPVIYPRLTATILEERVSRTLDKYQIDLQEIFCHADQIPRKITDMVSEIKIDELFGSVGKHMADNLNELKFGLNYIDPTLLGALETTRTRMDAHITALKEKTAAAQLRKHEAALRQVERAINSVFPRQNFQEREISLIHFLNKHGLGFARELADTLLINETGHQIIQTV
jgi:bacillithiol synthase